MELIEELLEKYWRGETNLKEENKLREFFYKEHVPEHLKPYQSLFVYQNNEKQRRVSRNFEEQVLDKIMQYEEPMRPTIRPSYVSSWIKYAAVIMLGLAIFAGYNYVQNNAKVDQLTHVTDTANTPEEAYAEARKALLLVSSHLNKGETGMSKLSTFNDVQEDYLLRN